MSICHQFENEDVVCPSELRRGIFTVGALDNTDHNLSATTAEGSFHGTRISVIQFSTQDTVGIERITSAYQPDTFAVLHEYVSYTGQSISYRA